MNTAAIAAPGDARTTPPPPAPADRLERIPLDQVHESKLNPRTHYDPEALAQLKDSLLASGQLEPVLVRPRKAGGYELAAGHRRFRAAKLACEQSPDGAKYRGLHELRAIVRDLDDRTFIETLNVSNLQRDDLHPLEEAHGFKDLMTECGYDVKKIAARIGKSERYVYDSLTLLKLIPEARTLFLDGAFERGHAVELARLATDWQKKALDRRFNSYGRGSGGLWEAEEIDGDPNAPKQERLKLEDKVKPVSVRELKQWINDTVRFVPAGIDPMLFPDTYRVVTTAMTDKEKVIEITYEHVVPETARDATAPQIYGAQAWRSATPGRVSPGYPGRAGKPCTHAVTGVIVIGGGRGDAFKVCIAKEKCATHWADWQKERTTRGKGTGSGTRTTREGPEREEERWHREEQEREALRQRWEKAQPAILQAAAAKIKTAPAGPTSDLASAVLDACMGDRGKANSAVPRGRTLEGFLRHAAFQLVVEDVRSLRWPGYYNHDRAVKNLKALGIDAAKIVDQVAREEKADKPQASAEPKKAKAKKSTKAKRR